MSLAIPFHDFLSLKTCLVSSGSLGSVSGGGSGSGSGSAFPLSLDRVVRLNCGDFLKVFRLLFPPPICLCLSSETSQQDESLCPELLRHALALTCSFPVKMFLFLPCLQSSFHAIKQLTHGVVFRVAIVSFCCVSNFNVRQQKNSVLVTLEGAW